MKPIIRNHFKVENFEMAKHTKHIFFAFLLCFSTPFILFSQCINVYPHVEDFESAPVWTAFTAPTSSVANSSDWAWGTPNHTYVITSAGSGSKCWSVGNTTGSFYNYWEQSYIQSPCYDFSNLLYPHIKFLLFYDSEYHFDGGNLQYSLDGGVTWSDVGTCGGTNSSPIPEPNDCNTQNWYNYPGVTYLDNPAGFVPSKNGWCGNTQAGGVGWDPANPSVSCVGGNGPGQWIEAEHCLTGCAGQPSVLLRFTFGSGYTCNNFDGFAIDSVAVSNGVPNVATFTNVCGVTPGSFNFIATPVACPTNTFSWNFGDPASGAANTSATQNASHTFSGPGSYTVTLIASGGACNPPDTITSVVNVMSAAVTSFSNAACGNPGSATVTVTSTIGPTTYTWLPAGGNAQTANNLAAGNYTVNVADAGSCPVTATISIAQVPTLSLSVGGTDMLCGNPGSATVTVNGGVAPFSYTWSPSGGNLPVANGLTAGNYTVTVTDNASCTASASVTINGSAGVSATLSVTNVTCNGGANGTGDATSSGGSPPYTYTWMPSGGNAASASGLSAGTYTVLVSDANGCTAEATATVTQPLPLLVTASGQHICYGQSATLVSTATGGSGAPYTYLWSTGATSSSFTVQTVTTSVYSLTVTDAQGCIASDTAQVYVSAPLEILVSPNDTVCAGQPANLSATASGGNGSYNIVWLPVNMVSNSITVNPTSSTLYTAIVSDGCSVPDSAACSVVVLAEPTLNFGANPASGCQPVCAVFAGVSTNVPGNGIVSYTWNFGDGSIGSGLNASHCYENSGNYNVTLSGVTQQGCKDSVTITNVIHVFPKPVADFNVSPSYTTDIYNNTINFYDASIGTIQSWNWNIAGLQNSSQQNTSYTFESEGVYPVTLVVTSPGGCADTISKEIVIMPDYTFYAPNAFSPNADGINEEFRPLGTAWDLNRYNLWIFDRWGNQVFFTDNANAGWDGTRGGNDVQEDTYVWKVRLHDIFGRAHEYNGQINLIR